MLFHPQAIKDRKGARTIGRKTCQKRRKKQVLQDAQASYQVQPLRHDADVAAAPAVEGRTRKRRKRLPATSMVPSLGASSPATRFRKVVLPLPEAPSTSQCSPAAASKRSSA